MGTLRGVLDYTVLGILVGLVDGICGLNCLFGSREVIPSITCTGRGVALRVSSFLHQVELCTIPPSKTTPPPASPAITCDETSPRAVVEAFDWER